jgi:hypothetical protein
MSTSMSRSGLPRGGAMIAGAAIVREPSRQEPDVESGPAV